MRPALIILPLIALFTLTCCKKHHQPRNTTEEKTTNKKPTYKDFNDFYAPHTKRFTDIKGHTNSTLDEFHDNLMLELNKVGNACDLSLSAPQGEDFFFSSFSLSSVPIGIKVDNAKPRLITAVITALQATPINYSVLLELNDAMVVIERDGKVTGFSDDGDLDSVLNLIR